MMVYLFLYSYIQHVKHGKIRRLLHNANSIDLQRTNFKTKFFIIMVIDLGNARHTSVKRCATGKRNRRKLRDVSTSA